MKIKLQWSQISNLMKNLKLNVRDLILSISHQILPRLHDLICASYICFIAYIRLEIFAVFFYVWSVSLPFSKQFSLLTSCLFACILAVY